MKNKLTFSSLLESKHRQIGNLHSLISSYEADNSGHYKIIIHNAQLKICNNDSILIPHHKKKNDAFLFTKLLSSSQKQIQQTNNCLKLNHEKCDMKNLQICKRQELNYMQDNEIHQAYLNPEKIQQQCFQKTRLYTINESFSQILQDEDSIDVQPKQSKFESDILAQQQSLQIKDEVNNITDILVQISMNKKKVPKKQQFYNQENDNENMNIKKQGYNFKNLVFQQVYKINSEQQSPIKSLQFFMKDNSDKKFRIILNNQSKKILNDNSMM